MDRERERERERERDRNRYSQEKLTETSVRGSKYPKLVREKNALAKLSDKGIDKRHEVAPIPNNNARE